MNSENPQMAVTAVFRSLMLLHLIWSCVIGLESLLSGSSGYRYHFRKTYCMHFNERNRKSPKGCHVPNVMGCTCNLSTQKQKAGRQWVPEQPGATSWDCLMFRVPEQLFDLRWVWHSKFKIFPFYSYCISILTLSEESDGIVLHAYSMEWLG
jgi:hypothetical protein